MAIAAMWTCESTEGGDGNMIRRALLWLTVVVALVAFGVPGANAHVTRGGPNAVTKWNGIATSTLVQLPGPAGGAPSALQINMGMTQGAVYDAVNAITRKHRPYLLKRHFSAGASREAAVATAAYRVLSNIVSTGLFAVDGGALPGQWVHAARRAALVSRIRA
jgi:hypothetical protein